MDTLLPGIASVLSTTPERWQRLAQSIPEDLLRRAPLPGEWSAVECLQHLLDTEPLFHYRIACFLAGQDFPAFDPDTQGTQTVQQQPAGEMAASLVRLRQEGLRALEGVSVIDLERRVRHAELGPVTLRQMLAEWAAHDLMHTVQAERALMQPFIDESGPWQKYFLDHWVGAQK